ncbi:Mitochondrial ribosomal protein l28 [Globisporangium polare]
MSVFSAAPSTAMNFLAAFTRAAAKPKHQHISGRAARGLFAGRDKAFGNNVSFSKRKTRRDWKVNHQWKHLYSEALDEKVGLNVTTHTLRCIDKAGGLDNYLLGVKKESELGIKGLKARDRIAEALANASAGVAASSELSQ